MEIHCWSITIKLTLQQSDYVTETLRGRWYGDVKYVVMIYHIGTAVKRSPARIWETIYRAPKMLKGASKGSKGLSSEHIWQERNCIACGQAIEL